MLATSLRTIIKLHYPALKFSRSFYEVVDQLLEFILVKSLIHFYKQPSSSLKLLIHYLLPSTQHLGGSLEEENALEEVIVTETQKIAVCLKDNQNKAMSSVSKRSNRWSRKSIISSRIGQLSPKSQLKANLMTCLSTDTVSMHLLLYPQTKIQKLVERLDEDELLSITCVLNWVGRQLLLHSVNYLKKRGKRSKEDGKVKEEMFQAPTTKKMMKQKTSEEVEKGKEKEKGEEDEEEDDEKEVVTSTAVLYSIEAKSETALCDLFSNFPVTDCIHNHHNNHNSHNGHNGHNQSSSPSLKDSTLISGLLAEFTDMNSAVKTKPNKKKKKKKKGAARGKHGKMAKEEEEEAKKKDQEGGNEEEEEEEEDEEEEVVEKLKKVRKEIREVKRQRRRVQKEKRRLRREREDMARSSTSTSSSDLSTDALPTFSLPPALESAFPSATPTSRNQPKLKEHLCKLSNACNVVTTLRMLPKQETEKAGTVFFFDETNNRWMKQWAVLSDGILYCFMKQNDGRVAAIIEPKHIDELRIVDDPRKKIKHQLHFVGDSFTMLCVSTSDERLAWITALTGKTSQHLPMLRFRSKQRHRRGSFSPSPPILTYSGWAVKQGHIVKNLKRRFFVLFQNPPELRYYKQEYTLESKPKALGVVDLKKIEELNTITLSKVPTAPVFELVAPKYKLIIICENRRARYRWIEELCKVLDAMDN